MKKFALGEIVWWEVKKGVRPRGKIVKIMENYGGPGDTRYEVEALDTMTWHSKHLGREVTINKGDKLQPYEIHKTR